MVWYRYPNPLQILPWTIGDIGWRAEQGRIAPVGVFFQHALYWFGSATATGMSVNAAEGITTFGALLFSLWGWYRLVKIVWRAYWMTGESMRAARGGRGLWVLPLWGAGTTLAYEMHYPTVLVSAGAIIGYSTSPQLRRKSLALLLVPFGAAAAVVRAILHYVAHGGYSGLKPRADHRVLTNMAAEFGNAVSTLWELTAAGAGVAGLVLLGGYVLLRAERPIDDDSDTSKLRWLIGGMVATLLEVAAIMALSVRAQEVVAPGVAYRSAPMLSLLGASLAILCLAYIKRGRQTAIWVALAIAVALVAGNWGGSASAAREWRHNPRVAAYEQLGEIVAHGEPDASVRCRALAAAYNDGANEYSKNTYYAHMLAYQARWGESLCPGKTVPPERKAKLKY